MIRGATRHAGAGVGRALWWLVPLAGLAALAAFDAILEGPAPLRHQGCWPALRGDDADQAAAAAFEAFEGFDNETGVSGAPIVPNVVHFLRLGQPEFTLLEEACVLAAWRNQRPDWLMFHTDLDDFRGARWARLRATPGLRDAIQLVRAERPSHVFGQPLDPNNGRWHAGDILRIDILRKYGGIFLDNDSYLLQSLDALRHFEMSLGWPIGQYLGTQVLVAHPEARFLYLWRETYREYVGRLWYYNAGERPTKMALWPRPELVHREPERVDVNMAVIGELYATRAGRDWHARHLAVHLFERHNGLAAGEAAAWGLRYPVTFTEDNICAYNVTVRDLVLDVLPELCRGGGSDVDDDGDRS